MLERNLKGLCERLGIDYLEFLNDLNVDHAKELSLFDIEAICEENQLDVQQILFKPLYLNSALTSKLSKLKLLVLDVDGVMTDGGMYFTESGDQFKKYNTKDGMAVIRLTKNNFPVAIISSGFKAEAVKARAEMLGIQHCVVSRGNKLEILTGICKELQIELSEVAMIGDDVNDLEVMKVIGFSACPSDALPVIKTNCDIILNLPGGRGCVREFIDNYMLPEPMTKP